MVVDLIADTLTKEYTPTSIIERVNAAAIVITTTSLENTKPHGFSHITT